MTHQFDHSERGQALVLLVLGFVVLLGFTALAVDGGMVYADRRHAQNGSDASSLAGGGSAAKYLETRHIYYNTPNFCAEAAPSLTAAETAAINRAADNDFTLERSGTNRVEANCVSRWNGSWIDRFIDVTTTLTVDTRTSFVHFVYRGPVRNSVEAVTRLYPRTPLMFGNAVVALNEGDCSGNSNGVLYNGSGGVTIYGGGIFSNGCLGGNGSGEVTVYDADIVGFDDDDHGVYDPEPTWATGPRLDAGDFQVPRPPCPTTPTGSDLNHASGLIPAGNYRSITLHGSAQLVGGSLYCIDGDFDARNENLSIQETGGKDWVTIFLRTGRFISQGGGEIVLKAPPAAVDAAPAVNGILFYVETNEPDSTHPCITLTGNATSSFTGVVYAPTCSIKAVGTTGSGTGSPRLETQLIGWNVEFSGTPEITVYYDGQKLFDRPTSIELFK